MEHPGHDFRFRGKTSNRAEFSNFLAYESDEKRAIELVRTRVPVNEDELVEAVAEVAENQFVGPGMRPGDVRRLGKNPDLDEGQ
jgi:hypothetical protein